MKAIQLGSSAWDSNTRVVYQPTPTQVLVPIARWSAVNNEDRFLTKYLWKHYSGWFDLEDYYFDIKSYEKTYNTSSSKMYAKWKKGSQSLYGAEINNWLIKYIQIKDILVEAK